MTPWDNFPILLYVTKGNQMNDENLFTTRKLRIVLFNIKDQEMTVRELREILYQMNAQDETVPYSLISGLYNQAKSK